MKPLPAYPSLYQINTRVWLTGLSHALGRPATLDDVPDGELDRLAERGFDWVWLLSVWQTGLAAQQVSRSNPEWRKEFAETLPDLREEDIAGSGFAIAEYTVSARLGGLSALARLRDRLRQRGIRLMLDFVPNHMAPDHPWVGQHPDFFVHGSEEDLQRAPQNYRRLETAGGSEIVAYGRDPYFSGWPDTVQLNYGNPATQQAMIGELLAIAGQCDGVRCDMAMLILPEVFERTWGISCSPFWPQAIGRVREQSPGFIFMAEVYWDLEWTMLQQGFDYAYDKRLYDRLRDESAGPVRDHLRADAAYQDRLVRFLENHDEARAADAFSPEVYETAAILTYLTPGLRFFHQGQFEGRMKRISPHLVRAPDEPVDPWLPPFYERLLALLRRTILRDGHWRLLECTAAWEGNASSDAYIAWAWQDSGGERLLIAVNYAPHAGQCYVQLPAAELSGCTLRFRDLMSYASYERDGNDLLARGLYLDMPPWSYHVFLQDFVTC